MAEYKILSFADKVERKAIREEQKKTHQRFLEVARKMKADGLSADKIVSYTGLPSEEIKKL
ncbi:hypothetical protein AGMMS49587_03590 [Spirochaetia bacterium]|nr:hypothetical protein AGMMS49587_03590 [Spirochaetia bacterium]